MSEIPEHIEKAALEVCRKVEAMPSAGNAFIVADEIWRRVLAERYRCSQAARDYLANEYMPDFGSLPDDLAAAIHEE